MIQCTRSSLRFLVSLVPMVKNFAPPARNKIIKYYYFWTQPPRSPMLLGPSITISIRRSLLYIQYTLCILVVSLLRMKLTEMQCRLSLTLLQYFTIRSYEYVTVLMLWIWSNGLYKILRLRRNIKNMILIFIQQINQTI